MLVSVANYGRKSMLEWLLGLPIEAKKWKLYYPPRWAGGNCHHCLLCKLENERCAGAALSSEGSFRSRDIQCGPRSLRAVMLGFSFYGSRRRPV